MGWTAGRDGESLLGPLNMFKGFLLTFLTLYDIYRYIDRYPGKMGRMYGNGKGLSRSALPYKRSAPSWLKVTSNEVSLDGYSSGFVLNYILFTEIYWCIFCARGMIGRAETLGKDGRGVGGRSERSMLVSCDTRDI